jgi:hypothetical protein
MHKQYLPNVFFLNWKTCFFAEALTNMTEQGFTTAIVNIVWDILYISAYSAQIPPYENVGYFTKIIQITYAAFKMDNVTRLLFRYVTVEAAYRR